VALSGSQEGLAARCAAKMSAESVAPSRTAKRGLALQLSWIKAGAQEGCLFW